MATISQTVSAQAFDRRLGSVLEETASLLPDELGEQLLQLVTPESLAAMAAAVLVWASAHLFGVGEIADVVLLVAGYAALGGVAVEAAQHITASLRLTMKARAQSDLDSAARHLASAVALVGVQAAFTILLRKKPSGTFKQFYGKPVPSVRTTLPIIRESLLGSEGPRYRPRTVFTRQLELGKGRTDFFGNSRIGRNSESQLASGLARADQELRLALYHEKVHQFLTPKLNLLRELRLYAAQSGYSRSYLLRYLEEALAETVAQVRVYGFTPEEVFSGLKFPLRGNRYVSLQGLKDEASGILLGPVVVQGMWLNVFYNHERSSSDR